MARQMSTHTRWATAFAATASLAIASSAAAQTPPPATPPAQTPPPATAAQDPAAAPNPTQDAAKQQLTAARNALSELTQLPAASQLTGEARTQVPATNQQLQRADHDQYQLACVVRQGRGNAWKPWANLNPPPAASGTAGAVGTSGTTPAIDSGPSRQLVQVPRTSEQVRGHRCRDACACRGTGGCRERVANRGASQHATGNGIDDVRPLQRQRQQPLIRQNRGRIPSPGPNSVCRGHPPAHRSD